MQRSAARTRVAADLQEVDQGIAPWPLSLRFIARSVLNGSSRRVACMRPRLRSMAALDLGGVIRVRQPRWHMTGSVRQPFPSLAVDINQPGSFVHWSIFDISVANLVLIAVMVVIFGVALLLPFPRSRREETATVAGSETEGPADGGRVASGDPADDGTASMWTARVRRRALGALPPGKLLPDSQPAYVASWAYVFGVASLAALGVAIVSGFALALGGPDWWHYNPVGHFCNSLHLWSVELFMALLVIHLWAKFWMAAWRGRRALTWMTGVVAFAASVLECFTRDGSQEKL